MAYCQGHGFERYNLEMERGVKAGGTLQTEAQMEEEAKRSDSETANQRDGRGEFVQRKLEKNLRNRW